MSLPLDDRSGERFIAAICGRPDLMGKCMSLTLYGGTEGIGEWSMIDVKNRSHTITAEVEIPKQSGQRRDYLSGGPLRRLELVPQGRQTILRLQLGGANATRSTLPIRCRRGHATIRYAFVYDGGPLGSGGTGTLFVNSKKVAEGRIEKTVPYMFSLSETADVGEDTGTPVTEDYPRGAQPFHGHDSQSGDRSRPAATFRGPAKGFRERPSSLLCRPNEWRRSSAEWFKRLRQGLAEGSVPARVKRNLTCPGQRDGWLSGRLLPDPLCTARAIRLRRFHSRRRRRPGDLWLPVPDGRPSSGPIASGNP